MNRIVVMAAAATALVFGLGVAGAQTEKAPSKGELQRLVSAAKTPKEHTTVAAHYRKLAEQLDQEAAEYDQLGKEYGKHPQLLRRKGAADTLGRVHCENLATFARKAAAEQRALASIHEEAATEAAVKR